MQQRGDVGRSRGKVSERDSPGTRSLESSAPGLDARPGDTVPGRASSAASELGRLGGTARARKLTPEQRQEIARKAAARRWRKAE